MEDHNKASVVLIGVYTHKNGRRSARVAITGPDGNTITKKMLYARFLWESVYGPTPAGYDVHHLDGDRTNDVIENLAAVERRAHLSQHGFENSNNRVGTDGKIERFCSKCELWKPLASYYSRTRVRKSVGRIVQGAMNVCVECSKATYNDWRKNNREARNATNLQWRKDNPEALRASKRASHVKHREANNARSRASYAAHREARLASARAYRAAHREEILAKKRAYEAKKRAQRKKKEVPS